MNIEIIYYAIYSLIAIFSSFFLKEKFSDRIFFIFWIMLTLALSAVVRNKNFDVDIATYAASLEHNFISLYYLREPLVWGALMGIYRITESQILSFIICDAISFLIIYKTLRNFGSPRYIYFSILLLFPFFLGLQNIYRQYFAQILILYALSFLHTSSKRWKIPFILAVLCHNSAMVFIPFFVHRKSSYFHLKTIACIALSWALIYIGASSKSDAETGSNTLPLYFSIFLFSIFSLILHFKFKLNFNSNLFRINFISLLICFPAMLISSSGTAERICMYAVCAIYILFSIFIEEKFKEKKIIRFLTTLMTCSVIYITPSTYSFIN